MIMAFRSIRWNSWRWRPLLERWGHLRVFIDPDIIKTTTFLFQGNTPTSTVFFARWFLETGQYAHYAITTRHSIQYDKVEIRFNTHAGIPEPQEFLPGDWFKSLSTDIALIPIDMYPLEKYDIGYVSVFDFASTKDDIYLPNSYRNFPYGTGDEIYSVGLFEGHPGQRPQPAVRFGHIALKPAEGERVIVEIEPEIYEPIDAFLVEMATWRGQSGSPVFLRVTYADHDAWDEPRVKEYDYLIGMVQGFYPGQQEIKIGDETAMLTRLQMGIGIVIPARDISEVLMRTDLEEQRKKLRRDKQQNPKIRPSAASIKKDKPPITKEGFEDTLKRVSRKTSEPES